MGNRRELALLPAGDCPDTSRNELPDLSSPLRNGGAMLSEQRPKILVGARTAELAPFEIRVGASGPMIRVEGGGNPAKRTLEAGR